MAFSTERADALWWLMISADSNAVRAAARPCSTEPQWREDVPRLVRGALGRQQRGHWNTTVANAWGVLAMEKFSARVRVDARDRRNGACATARTPTTLTLDAATRRAAARAAVAQTSQRTLDVHARAARARPWVDGARDAPRMPLERAALDRLSDHAHA